MPHDDATPGNFSHPGTEKHGVGPFVPRPKNPAAAYKDILEMQSGEVEMQSESADSQMEKASKMADAGGGESLAMVDWTSLDTNQGRL